MFSSSWASSSSSTGNTKRTVLQGRRDQRWLYGVLVLLPLLSSTARNLYYPVSNKVAWCIFYAIGWCWNASLIYLASSGSIQEINKRTWAHLFGLPHTLERAPLQFNVMMQVQLTRRLYETLFMQKFSDHRMHLVAFVAGISFYIFACSTIIVEVSTFQTSFGSSTSSVISWIPFIIGSVTQSQCHLILAKLRPTAKRRPQYSIPNGNMFGYISCPHYLAEICIYISFVILTEGKLILIWLLFAFVVENLTHSALRTHEWYKQKFKGEYPPLRKALLPYLL